MPDLLLTQSVSIVFALNYIGNFIKNIEAIPNKFIPFILLPLGIGACLALQGISWQSVLQGVFCTAGAVYADQTLKQIALQLNDENKEV